MKKKGKTDLDKLQGTWNIITLEMDGQSMSPGGSQIVIKGSRFTTKAMGAEYGGSLKVDESKKPKTFDLKFTSGPEKGNTSLGIYELEGDEWRICLTVTGKKRPTRFAAAPGSGVALETLTRETAASKKRAAAKTPAALAAQEEEAVGPGPAPEIEGEWTMVSCMWDGEPLDANMVKYGKRVARGNVMTVLMAGNPFLKARFKVDRSKKPTAMDYELVLGVNAGKIQFGIYELNGTTLKTSFANPGKPRPTNFSSAPGDGRTVTVWKLLKK
jgi:uncharacterized protein (TIGR03067 family)